MPYFRRRRALTRAAALLSGVVAMLAFALPASAGDGRPSAPAAQRCADLVGHQVRVDHDNAVITAAAIVPAAAGQPENCSTSGTIGNIHFVLQLPTQDWNQRYFQTGCGGFCGYVPITDCAKPLAGGFAVAAEDTGHQNRTDASWALNDRKAEIDWGYRSPHVMAVAAKGFIEAFYGRAPVYSYFQGCSTGGRQALSEAQRYPDDFDGIVAGAPALYQNYLAPLSQGYLETVNRDANHHVILPSAKLPLIHEAVLEECDGQDGAEDGVLADPESCDFDPATLQCPDDVDAADCLTSAQVAVYRAFLTPPVDSRGRQLYPGGLVVGSEDGWAGWSVGTDTSFSGGGTFAEQVLRYLAFPKDPGPTYSLYDFDPDRDAHKLRAMAQVFNADDVHLRRFHRNGGKLIVWHGWADPLISPEGTINYVRDAIAANGGRGATEDWLRLFLLPGVHHCTGGPGEDNVAWLDTVQRWVEDGVAPDSVEATKVDGAGNVISTRTVEQYDKF